jgi:hypothetical protein
MMDFMADVDTTEIGRLAVQVMEDVNDDYPGAEVKSVTVVVELEHGNRSVLEARSTESRKWVVEAMLRNSARSFEP